MASIDVSAKPEGKTTEVMPAKDFTPLSLGLSLLAQFDGRDDARDIGLDAGCVRSHDNVWLRLCAKLEHFPFYRWLGLCAAQDHEPVLLAAASYCEGYDPAAAAAEINAAQWIAWPNSRPALAAAFSKDNTETPVSMTQLTREAPKAKALTWRLAALDHCPQPDLSSEMALKLNDEPASILAWLFARHGFATDIEPWLWGWSKREGMLAFWAALAMVLRRPALHKQVDKLAILAGSDPVRQRYAASLAEAIAQGPYTPESAYSSVDNLFEGPRRHRLQRALRLAAFVPGQAPLVDPNMPFHRQQRFAEQIRLMLEKAVEAKAVFVPEVYRAERARAEVQNREEATKRERIEQRKFLRLWPDTDIEAALAAGPGVAITGCDEGEALLFTLAQKGGVAINAATKEIIHVGRPDYIYRAPDNLHTPNQSMKPVYQGYSLVLDPNAQFRDKAITIMVRLRDEYVDVWRPVAAQYVGDDIYYILPEQPHPEDEHWEFGKIAMVHCAKVAFMDGVHLTAIRKADQNRR